MKNTKLILGGLLFTSLNFYSQNGIHIPIAGPTGFNTANPANRVEITSGPTDPYGTNTTNGSSGLRLTNMTSANTPLTNTTTKVLSVDQNGDVILVNDQTITPGSALTTAQNGLSVIGGNTVEFGGPLGFASAATLLNNREIPMAGNNILFSGIGQNNNNQITLGSNPGILGKFNVRANEVTNGSSGSYAASFENNYVGSDCTAGYFSTSQSNTSFINYGITGAAQNGANNYGVYMNVGPTSNAGTSTGAKFVVTHNNNGGTTGLSAQATGGSISNVGVSGKATGPNGANYGGNFFGSGTAGALATGIQAGTNATGSLAIAGDFSSPSVDPSTGVPTFIPPTPPASNYGIRAFAPSNWANSLAILANGNFSVNGSAYCSNGPFWTNSDQRFKKNIQKLDKMTDKIKQINAYSYNFRTDEFKGKNFDNEEHLGFIAQELKEVFPQIVTTDPSGYYSVNYSGMIPVLIEVSKEQQSVFEQQQAQIDELMATVKALTTVNANKATGVAAVPVNVNLSDKNNVVLNQNVPNPFAESTVITYTIPNDFLKAQIVFSTVDGKVIKALDINEKGAGHLNVFADDLSHGLYNYSLIIDGKTIDTKKMIKE